MFGAVFVGRDREGAEPEVEVVGAAGYRAPPSSLALAPPLTSVKTFPMDLFLDGEAALRALFQLRSDGALGAFLLAL